MNILQLRYFTYVARLGSFTVASRRLDVAQSALSRQIKALEDELGVQLLARSTHYVRPTDMGLRLLQLASPILEDFDRIPEKLHETALEPVGQVTVGMLPSIAGYLTPSLLRQAADQMPHVKIEVLEGLNAVLREELRLGDIDVAVLTAGTLSGEFRETPLIEEEMVLTGHETLVRHIPDPVELSELADMPLISTEGFKEVAYASARASGFLLRFEMMQNSLAALKALLLHRFGLSILPLPVVYEEMMEGRLATRRIASPGLFRRLGLVHLASKRPPRSVMATQELIASELLKSIGAHRL